MNYFHFARRWLRGRGDRLGRLIFLCQVQTAKNYKSGVLVPRPKTVRIVSLRK